MSAALAPVALTGRRFNWRRFGVERWGHPTITGTRGPRSRNVDTENDIFTLCPSQDLVCNLTHCDKHATAACESMAAMAETPVVQHHKVAAAPGHDDLLLPQHAANRFEVSS